MSDHDPFNEPEVAHPRARALMTEEFFWDCTDEEAPFGSDEGWTAYYEWREWREENRSSQALDCFAWFLGGRLAEYNESLCTDAKVAADMENPDDAFMSESFDIFTLDTTVIGTALGQLLDEGVIDSNVKPLVQVAVSRQLNPLLCETEERREILLAIKRVVEAA